MRNYPPYRPLFENIEHLKSFSQVPPLLRSITQPRPRLTTHPPTSFVVTCTNFSFRNMHGVKFSTDMAISCRIPRRGSSLRCHSLPLVEAHEVRLWFCSCSWCERFTTSSHRLISPLMCVSLGSTPSHLLCTARAQRPDVELYQCELRAQFPRAEHVDCSTGTDAAYTSCVCTNVVGAKRDDGCHAHQVERGDQA